jgi:hypothetical protein
VRACKREKVGQGKLDKMTTYTDDISKWYTTLSIVILGVVSVHFRQPVAFDTKQAFSSQATVFVVDLEKGWILRNRHVVNAGSFQGFCVFDIEPTILSEA